MTWTVAITIAIGVILKMIMSPPSLVVDWLTSKFALHPKLNSKDVTITFNGNLLEEKARMRITDYFNEATFLKKYYIYPGNENLFLHPGTNVTPIVIHSKNGNKDVNFFVFSYDDHVDVVKQCGKKVVAYRLRSDHLQNYASSEKVI